MLLCDSFQESNCYQLLEIILPFPVQARTSRALNNFCHAGKTARFIGHSCSSPVDIDHQYRTESTHAGVEQWPQWENHCLHSFHFCKGSDQCRVSPWQCWKLRKIQFGRHLRPCAGKRLGCWCCCVTGSRNPIATSYRKSCCLFRFRARMRRALNISCHAGKQALAPVQCLDRIANWCGFLQ